VLDARTREAHAPANASAVRIASRKNDEKETMRDSGETRSVQLHRGGLTE
jgi:hypothetical protein